MHGAIVSGFEQRAIYYHLESKKDVRRLLTQCRHFFLRQNDHRDGTLILSKRCSGGAGLVEATLYGGASLRPGEIHIVWDMAGSTAAQRIMRPAAAGPNGARPPTV